MRGLQLLNEAAGTDSLYLDGENIVAHVTRNKVAHECALGVNSRQTALDNLAARAAGFWFETGPKVSLTEFVAKFLLSNLGSDLRRRFCVRASVLPALSRARRPGPPV